MKHTGRYVRVCAAGVATVALFLATTAQAEVGKAVVKSIKGSASVSEGGGWTALKSGKVLKPGAKVRTDAGSSVDLNLGANGPTVRLVENTTLGLDKLNFEATGADTVVETQLDVSSGRILGNVRKLAAASKYEIKTPVGVAGLRGNGGQYDISANGSVRVLEGSAVVVHSQPGKAPITQVVNTGEQFNPNSASATKVEPIAPGVATDDKAQLAQMGGTAATEVAAGGETAGVPNPFAALPKTDEDTSKVGGSSPNLFRDTLRIIEAANVRVVPPSGAQTNWQLVDGTTVLAVGATLSQLVAASPALQQTLNVSPTQLNTLSAEEDFSKRGPYTPVEL